MSNQLQLFPPPPAPPDRKKELERAIANTRRSVEAALQLIKAEISGQISTQADEALNAAISNIDSQVDNLDTLFCLVSADNDELKVAAGKLRSQRDDAIKARAQVLAYLRQLKQQRK
jgi:hypothetical protein